MLRRSTGVSEEVKRVGVERGKLWGSGDVKCRWVARVRLEVGEAVLSGEAVVVGGVSVAMDRRRLISGSCVVVAMFGKIGV